MTIRLIPITIFIPQKTKEIMLNISHSGMPLIHTARWQSFGLDGLYFLIDLADGKGDVVIKIPILDNHFFEKYFVEN